MSPDVARFHRSIYAARYGAGFARAVAFVLARETVLTRQGAVVTTRDPNDPGGTTKYGIDARGHRMSDAEVAALTEAEAVDIYHREEWARVRGALLPPDLDLVMLDTAVNPGWGLAIRWLQRAMGCNADGKFGPLTLACVQHLDADAEKAAIKSILAARLAYYWSLPAKKRGRPFRDRFIGGWSARVNLCRKEVGIEA